MEGPGQRAGGSQPCTARGARALPAAPVLVAAYLTGRAETARISTVRVAAAAIAAVHRAGGLADPAAAPGVRAALAGIARQQAARPDAAPRQAAPLSLAGAAALMALAPWPRRTGRGVESAKVAARRGLEDRAIVALSFCAGLRRSEIAALRWRDVSPAAPWRGQLKVRVRASKTNPEAAREDHRLLVRRFAAAVSALREADHPAADGRVVPLSPGQINRRIQRLADLAGLEGVSSHSGRRALGTPRPGRRARPKERVDHRRPAGRRLAVPPHGGPLRQRHRRRGRGRRAVLRRRRVRRAARRNGADARTSRWLRLSWAGMSMFKRGKRKQPPAAAPGNGEPPPAPAAGVSRAAGAVAAGVVARRALALSLAAWAAWWVPARAEPLSPRPAARQARQGGADGQTGSDGAAGPGAQEEQAARDEPAEPAPPQFDDEVVVVGSRAQPRSVTVSTVPIDAIPAEDIVSQGYTDVADRLRTIVPSYNVNPQPVGDAARLIRPANLRGLAPDHTLVLVNGRRRHRGAVITWIGNGVADGAQGPDISTIPAIALRRIEVLRDGAAAQYGSDAIAGVLNFLLKDDRSGGSVELHTGGYGAGDGRAYTVAANAGLPLGRTGFANLSLEYGNAGATSRSVQRDDAALLIAAGNDAVADPAQVWGSPRIDDDLKLWGNFGHLFATGVQAYGHANYASRRVASGFFFRNPNTRAAVFSADGGRSLLVGDVLDAQDGVADGSARCPAVPIADGRPAAGALARVFADPACFSFQERFPGGFTPQFGGDVRDASLVAGARGQLGGGVLWDASASAGSSEADFFIHDTVNASLGPATPTAFDPGLYRQAEAGLNVDFSYPLTTRIHLAGGAEWRNEQFEIGLGDEASWRIGPYAPQGFSAGSNGFPGFSPIAAGSWSRANTALYGDVEVRGEDEAWTVGGALRLEDFEDFGTTTNGKLSGRYRLTAALALRASASSGFRAPTPGQQNAFNVSTEFDHELMDLVNNGTIPSTSRVAQLRGGEPLQPERSASYALGAVLEAGALSITADYFRIRLADRLALTQLFALAPAEVDGLIAEGVTSARNLQNFRFFTNHFETRTQGLDLIATYAPPQLDDRTTLGFLFNHTGTAVTRFDPDVLDALRVRELEEAIPGTRWNATVRQALGRWRLLGRLSYYDEWFDSRDLYVYHGDAVVDVEASHPLGESVTLAVGGRNVFGNDPEENPIARAKGNRFSAHTPFGSNGGYYYARLNYAWGS